MKRSRSTTALRYLGFGFLLLVAFEACSSDSPPVPPPGPQTITISRVSLGRGAVGQGGDSGVLACDNEIDVSLDVTFWTFNEPGRCGTSLQCGQVRVSLFTDTGKPALASTVAASAGVALKLSPGSISSGRYVVEASLITDGGKVYPVTNGGTSTAQRAFSLTVPADGACQGAAGSGGSTDAEGGMGGFSGTPDFAAGAGGVSAGAGGV